MAVKQKTKETPEFPLKETIITEASVAMPEVQELPEAFLSRKERETGTIINETVRGMFMREATSGSDYNKIWSRIWGDAE